MNFLSSEALRDHSRFFLSSLTVFIVIRKFELAHGKEMIVVYNFEVVLSIVLCMWGDTTE